MNTTIASLQLISFLSKSSFISSKNGIIIRDINFRRSFSSFLSTKELNSICIIRSSFKHILSNAVAVSLLNYIYNYESRLNSVVNIRYSIFSNIRNQNSIGGALYCENCYLIVSNCHFNGCHAQSQGGAFAIKGYKLDVVNTCIYNCSAVKTDDRGCNAFYSLDCNGYVYQSAAYLSSPVYRLGADSLYDFSNLMAVVLFWNSTECHGQGGSSGGAFRSLSAGSYMNYSTIFNSSDYTTIETWYSSIILFRNNLVHNSRNHACHLWGISNTYSIYYQCLFFDCHKSFDSSYTSFSFNQCTSDYPYMSIASTSGFTTFPNQPIPACNALPLEITQNKYKGLQYIFLLHFLY